MRMALSGPLPSSPLTWGLGLEPPTVSLGRTWCDRSKSRAVCVSVKPHTPWKMNMEPEDDGFQKESPIPRVPFSGSMLNFGRVHSFWWSVWGNVGMYDASLSFHTNHLRWTAGKMVWPQLVPTCPLKPCRQLALLILLNRRMLRCTRVETWNPGLPNGRNFTWSDWSSSKIGLHCLVGVSKPSRLIWSDYIPMLKQKNQQITWRKKSSDSQFTCSPDSDSYRGSYFQ